MVSGWGRLHVFDKWRGRVQKSIDGVRTVLREKGKDYLMSRILIGLKTLTQSSAQPILSIHGMRGV
jgi:hypothetical protein